MIALLPMYDWPEVRAATDRLWAALRDALRAEGVAAPEALTRGGDPMAGWTDPGLVLGQTCGLPFVRHLRGRVTLLGAPDHAVPGCPPGFYCSVLVTRGRPGPRAAVNGFDSQSGWAALVRALGRPEEIVVTGSHAASLDAVRDGRADIAAIDAVSWRLALRHRDCTGLRVAGVTPPTPGLPLISALPDPGPLRRAAAAGIAALDRGAREALGIAGFVPMGPAAYDGIARHAPPMDSTAPPV